MLYQSFVLQNYCSTSVTQRQAIQYTTNISSYFEVSSVAVLISFEALVDDGLKLDDSGVFSQIIFRFAEKDVGSSITGFDCDLLRFL